MVRLIREKPLIFTITIGEIVKKKGMPLSPRSYLKEVKKELKRIKSEKKEKRSK